MKVEKLNRREISRSIAHLTAIQGQPGFIAKIALFAGVNKREIGCLFNEEQCTEIGCYDCKRLHALDNSNGLTLLLVKSLRSQGHGGCFLRLVPSILWKHFRNTTCFDCDFDLARRAAKQQAKLEFNDIAKIYRFVIESTETDKKQTRLLVDSCTPETAKHHLFCNIEALTKSYCRAWETFGLVLPVI